MRRPIGWWLKHLDRLIDQQFDTALGRSGLDRRRWQLLNVLSEGPATEPELGAAVRPFWEDEGAELGMALAGLARDGCIARDGDGRWTLTDDGRAVLDGARPAVDSIRARLTEGLSPADYERTIAVLARMAANLDPATDTAGTGGPA